MLSVTVYCILNLDFAIDNAFISYELIFLKRTSYPWLLAASLELRKPLWLSGL